MSAHGHIIKCIIISGITKSGDSCCYIVFVSRNQQIRSKVAGNTHSLIITRQLMRMQKQYKEIQQRSKICLPSHLWILFCTLLISISQNICSGTRTSTHHILDKVYLNVTFVPCHTNHKLHAATILVNIAPYTQ